MLNLYSTSFKEEHVSCWPSCDILNTSSFYFLDGTWKVCHLLSLLCLFSLQQEQLNRVKHANGEERDETPTPIRMLRDEREAYDRKDEESRALAEQLDAFKQAHDKKEEDLKNLAEQMEEMNQMMEEQQKLLEDQHSKLKEQEHLINDREERMKELEKLVEESKEEAPKKDEYDKALKGNRLVYVYSYFN